MVEIDKVWLTEDAVCLRTKDGREAREFIKDYPHLAAADKEALSSFVVDDYGISWPELDEDLSFEGFFEVRPANVLYCIFKSHPELNASAVARRVGISQSLFAQYLSGIKKPSDKRLKEILTSIKEASQSIIDSCNQSSESCR